MFIPYLMGYHPVINSIYYFCCFSFFFVFILMTFNCDWNCINIHLKHHPTSPLNPSPMPFLIRYITHAECVSYRAKYHPIINLIRHFCCFHLNFFKFSTWGPFIVKKHKFERSPAFSVESIFDAVFNSKPSIEYIPYHIGSSSIQQ